jgi:Protein of unknown function (DUF3106)
MTRMLRTGSTALLVAWLVAPGARAGEAEGLQRLRSLPRAQRVRLARNLDELDRLPPGQRRAVEQLDARLAELPPTERRRYQALMHRYHLWVQGLEPAQRQQLLAAPVAERLDLIRQLRAAGRRAPDRRGDAIWDRSTIFNPVSPFEAAHRIKVWLALEPSQRAELARRDPSDAAKQLDRLGQERGIETERPREIEELRSRLESGLPVRDGPLSAKELQELKRQFPLLAGAGLRGLAATKRAQVRAALVRRLEASYLRTHAPTPVDAAQLTRFEAALPSWMDEVLDPLPPEAARRRLTILYRLVFPAPQEMPEPNPAAPGPPPGAPSPAAPPPGARPS